jgi:hypothetical protein
MSDWNSEMNATVPIARKMIVSLFLWFCGMFSSQSISSIVSEFEEMPSLCRFLHVAGCSQSQSRIEDGKDGEFGKIRIELDKLEIL